MAAQRAGSSPRSVCSLASTTGHCSSSASIVCPSGPGAPLFDATFNNALVNRLATSSIVAGAAIPNLAGRLRRSRPKDPKPVPGPPAGSSLRGFCCRDRQAKLHRRFFDRDRLPLPTGAAARFPPSRGGRGARAPRPDPAPRRDGTTGPAATTNAPTPASESQNPTALGRPTRLLAPQAPSFSSLKWYSRVVLRATSSA